MKHHIDKIRENYRREMKGKHNGHRQRATAIYLIDFLALRVGNEKDTSEVADTVGCCSLRVEHLTFQEPRTVTFDFLGKDSMRYHNTVELDEQAYKNLKDFTVGKKKNEDVFDALTPPSLNDHLKSLMPGLTAKVFRTYNASITLQNELRTNPVDPNLSVAQKLVFYNAANRQVAILCNHQKTVSKGHEGQMTKLQDQYDEAVDDKEELEEALEEIKGKKKDKKSKDSERVKARKARRMERHKRYVAEIKEKKEKKKAEKAKLKAAGQTVSDNESDDEVEFKEKSIPSDVSKIKAAIERLAMKIENLEAKIAVKEENKTVALGTSKINYMDPRISVAWCKANEVPIEKVFTKQLVSKFPWAMEVPSTWTF